MSLRSIHDGLPKEAFAHIVLIFFRSWLSRASTVKTLYKNPLFKNLSPYPGGIHKIQVASTLRTIGYPSFGGQVLHFWGSFPHQGNLESKTKFPNPPHQQTLCPSITSVCWLAKARYATAQWLRTRSGNTRLLFRTLLMSCRLGLPAPRLLKFRIGN